MTLSIKQKLIFAYTLIFGIVLIIFAFIIYQSIRQNETERIDSSIKSYSIVLQSEIEEQASDENYINPVELRSVKAEGLQDVRLALYDSKGNKILSDSLAGDKEKWESAILNRPVTETIKTPSGSNYRSYWSGVECNGKIEYALQVMASMKQTDNSLSRLLFIMSVIIPFALVIAGFTAWLISRAAFKPVVKMSRTAREISVKSLDKRLELPATKDEIFYLGSTLNEMISRLDDSFKSHRQFISDASHEIRTPLTILQTELELLENKLTESPDRESIRTALLEIESLSKLTTSLLTLAKLDSSQHSLNLEPVRLDELLIESIQFMRKAACGRDISLDLRIDEPVEINADRDKLKSVFINLIDNAVKYSSDNSAVRIIMEKSRGRINITFVNFGILIKPSELNSIFDRFYRSNAVNSVIKGNGLGLTIAKEFVELHKGSISVESDVHSGTRFTIDLPA
ncbi:MAG TPA: ATP-binding protein [Ignavibacteriales bacterium]|nr:ATP-binding protein [Ignavibacteriales bacterium]